MRLSTWRRHFIIVLSAIAVGIILPPLAPAHAGPQRAEGSYASGHWAAPRGKVEGRFRGRHVRKFAYRPRMPRIMDRLNDPSLGQGSDCSIFSSLPPQACPTWPLRSLP
jgi:hypothetical protein